jgi:hypothetical protein
MDDRVEADISSEEQVQIKVEANVGEARAKKRGIVAFQGKIFET